VLLTPYTAIAGPLVFLLQRSLTVPPVLVNGAAPKNPPMKRQTITVPILGARATGIWKMTRRNQLLCISTRPSTSCGVNIRNKVDGTSPIVLAQRCQNQRTYGEPQNIHSKTQRRNFRRNPKLCRSVCRSARPASSTETRQDIAHADQHRDVPLPRLAPIPRVVLVIGGVCDVYWLARVRVLSHPLEGIIFV